MKINDIILEKLVDRGPEEDALARSEYAVLKRVSPEFADFFMNAYNELGSVDAAYERARNVSLQRKSMLGQIKDPRKIFKGPDDAALDKAIGGIGRGKYTQYKDGTPRKQPRDPSNISRGSFRPTTKDPIDNVLSTDIFTTTDPFKAGLVKGDEIADKLKLNFRTPSWAKGEDNTEFWNTMASRSTKKNLRKGS